MKYYLIPPGLQSCLISTCFMCISLGLGLAIASVFEYFDFGIYFQTIGFIIGAGFSYGVYLILSGRSNNG